MTAATAGSAVTSRSRFPRKSRVEVGVDTVRLRGPLAVMPDLDGFQSFRGVRDPTIGTIRYTALGQPLPSGVVLQLDLRWGPAAWFEMSVPEKIYGSNLHPSSAEEVRELVQTIYRQAARYIRWAVDLPDLNVMRLDTVKHFHGVDDPHSVIDALKAVPLPTGSALRCMPRPTAVPPSGAHLGVHGGPPLCTRSAKRFSHEHGDAGTPHLTANACTGKPQKQPGSSVAKSSLGSPCSSSVASLL